MKLARVTGTVTATVKAPGLTGHKLLVVDIVDARGAVLEPARVAVDATGAGKGDLCLLVEGSSARLPAPVAGLPVDATLIGIVDAVSI
jgi:ethanolamine utilization protein EutN